MLTRIFILLTILKVCYCEKCGCGVWGYGKTVSDCGECEENKCKTCNNYLNGFNTGNYCYWNDHSKTCAKSGGILHFTGPK